MDRTYSSVALSIAIVVGSRARAAPAAATTTLVVCPTGCTYSTIQAALSAASAGDTIVVRPGTYDGPITITTPVTLCSTGSSGTSCANNPSNVIIDGNAAIYPVWIDANDVVLRGFTIRNPEYTTVDQDFGIVDPSLVVVDGDRAWIRGNVLEDVAAPPLPGQTRWYTIGINVVSGADLRITGNVMRDFPASIGPGATCATAPCKVVAIHNWGGGAGFVVADNDIRVLGTGAPATAVQFKSQANVEIRNNFIRMPGSSPTSGIADGVTGIYTSTSSTGALIEGNDVATGLTETPYGLYGIVGVFHGSTFRDNILRLSQHGIMLRTSLAGGNVVEDNTFFDNNQGLLNYAKGTLVERNSFDLHARSVFLDAVAGTPPGSSTDVVLRENKFRNATVNLGVADGVTSTFVDARENDWGWYERDLIEARNEDASGTNDVEIRCFIAEDGVTRVCPTASFTTTILTPTWPRPVRLTDTSVASGSSIASREWTLPGGATSSDEVVDLSLTPGSYTFTLDITDEQGFDDSATQTLTLSNTGVALSLASSYAASEGTPFTLAVPASDADGDDIAYTLLSGPAGATLSSAGVLSWNPSYTSAGSHGFTVRVSDGASTATGSSTIVVANVPVGPTLTPIADASVRELHTLTRAVTASSPSGSPISLVASVPTGASFVDNGGGSGTFSWTPPAGSQNTYTVTVSATSEGITVTDSFDVHVIVDVALRMDRVSPSTIQTVPGTVVTVVTRVTNLGSATDTFDLTTSLNRPWTVSAPTSLTLAAGASAQVSQIVTVPVNGDVASVSLRACSQASTSVCQQLSTRVEVPIFVELVLAREYSAFEAIRGLVVARFLDGSPVPGAAATFAEEWEDGEGILGTTTSGVTNSTGAFAFEVNSLNGRLPGKHVAYATVKRGDVTGFAIGSYWVTPL